MLALAIASVPLALTAIAAMNDVRAFTAIATPIVYAWLVLCCICGIGIMIVTYGIGGNVPTYFRIVLLIGVAAGLMAVPPAWEVVTKKEAGNNTDQVPDPRDLRGQVVSNTVYANRDLRRAQLYRATLDHVDLSGSNLSESDLRDARLNDVNLSGVNFCGADLRGADLVGARGLGDVKNWAYAYYDADTRLPRDYDFVTIPGPIPDTGRGLLYMCTTNETQRIEP